MINNRITVRKDGVGCIQVSWEAFDDIPDMVRFNVREADGDEEYEVDCALYLDDMEYIAKRIIDAVEYQRNHPNCEKK